MKSRVFRLLSALYPRAWRERYGDELADLCDEFAEGGEIARWQLAVNVVTAASAERLRSWCRSGRRLEIGGGATAVVALAIVAAATDGFGSFNAALPSKGPIPINANVDGHLDLSQVPDFVSVVSNGHVVGYAPKADLFTSRTKRVQLGIVVPPAVTPVYGSDLNTLVGHVYPGTGFVPLGTPSSAKTCVPITAVSDDQADAIPCGPIAVAIPNVVGMFTPTGVADLSGLGLSVQIVNVKSAMVAPGHIVSTSPNAGTSMAVRSVITVDISVRT